MKKDKNLKSKPIRLPQLATKSKPGQFNRDGKLYAKLWQYLQDDWFKTARTYEANPSSFYNAWHYLAEHPIYWTLNRNLDKKTLLHVKNLEHGYGFDNGGIWMSVARVNPETGSVHKDSFLNTRTEIWLETGEFAWEERPEYSIQPGQHYHNYKIDTGGETYEEAVIKMARNVWKYYGNDRRKCEPGWSMRRQAANDKKRAADPFTHNVIYPRYAYGHVCRHSYPPGFEGEMQMRKDEYNHAPKKQAATPSPEPEEQSHEQEERATREE